MTELSISRNGPTAAKVTEAAKPGQGAELPARQDAKQAQRRRLAVWRQFAVDAAGLAMLLGCSLRAIRAWHAGGKLPAPITLGNRVLWPTREIRNWLAAGAPCRDEWHARKQAAARQKPRR